jgi:YccS/YhfK family integral membrane protein
MGAEWKMVFRYGWKTEGLSRGLRAFLALASVMLGGLWLGLAHGLIALLLGVIAGALAETEGTWRSQIKAQCMTLLCFSLMALAVQASLPYPGLLIVVLGSAAFTLTLLGALGERYRTIAFATLILALYVALAAQPQQSITPLFAQSGPVAMVLAGAAWYGLIAIFWAAALPMLRVRQHLVQLYRVLGDYLQLKARLFEPVRGVDLERRRLALALQNGRVVEALNQAKESLLTRLGPGRAPAWLPTAMHLYFSAQDIHERASSSHEHYDVLVKVFFHSDVLYRSQRLLTLQGRDCRALTQAIAQQKIWQRDGATARALEDLSAAINHVAAQPDPASGNLAALRPLRALAGNLATMDGVIGNALTPQAGQALADSRLLDRQPHGVRETWQRLKGQLGLQAAPMRHAVRLTVALVAAYGAMLVMNDSHGFWLMLTVVFVCRPGYGATLKRLAQRISGTALGLVIGWALLRLFPDPLLQSAFTVMAGALFFATRQSRYTLATAAITSLVLLSFNALGDSFGLILPRLLDTVAGSVIAALAVWLVLPSWQSRQIHRVAAQAMRAQADYLRAIVAQYQGGKQDHLAYRLARRNAHNADAALSNTLSAVFQEPVYVRRHAAAGTTFLVLSHTLLNYLSALGAQRKDGLDISGEAVEQRAANQIVQTLDALAAALQAGQLVAPAYTGDEALLLKRLASGPQDGVAEGQRLLQSQLILVLGLLQPLREQATALLAPSPAGATHATPTDGASVPAAAPPD